MKSQPKKKPPARQRHHIRYGKPEEELVLPIRKGEHDCLTRMRRYCRKNMTEEFALCVLYEVLDAYMQGKIVRRK